MNFLPPYVLHFPSISSAGLITRIIFLWGVPIVNLLVVECLSSLL
jgi:hypothetical protein